MSAASRGERQLMRQRGAGLRNVSDVSFGLKFDAQNGREERLLMRQRGAGNRQMNNIDFGLDFPSRRQSRASTSRTPLSNRRRSSRVSKTPATSKENDDATAITRGVSEERLPSSTASQTATSGLHSAKRRKTNDEAAHPMSTRRRKSSGVTFAILEEPEDRPDAAVDVSAEGSRNTSAMFFPDDNEKENESGTVEDGENVKSLKVSIQKQQASLQQRRTRPSLNVAEAPVAITIERDSSEPMDQEDLNEVAELEDGKRADGSTGSDLASTESQQQPKSLPAKKRRKRKSVVLVRKKRRSSGESSAVSNVVEKGHTNGEAAETSIPDLVTNPEESDSTQLSVLSSETQNNTTGHTRNLRRNRTNRLSISATPDLRHDDNEDEDESYVDEEHTPDPTTPAPKHKQQTKPKSNSLNHETKKPKVARSSQSSFPILVHRMNNTHMLPTIHEEEEEINRQGVGEKLDPDLFRDRSAPNAVDILAQICRETVDTAIEQLGNQTATKENRAQVRRKRTALEAFGKELDQRLFDMSEAVEYRLTLAARLRKSNREKSDLQMRWLEIRRQRDELALRADAARRRNWEHEEEHKTRWEVSELAHTVGLQLQTEEPTVGLEFMLRNVADCVSNAQDGPGLLDRIRSFNMRLERVATALEGRR